MKVFRKKKREIIIDGHAFSWIVNETATHVKVRCYSLKSTYIEVIFNWGIATWVNASDFTGFCIDNIRYEKVSGAANAPKFKLIGM